MVGVQLFHLASFLTISSVQTNDIFLLHNLGPIKWLKEGCIQAKNPAELIK